MDCEELVSRLDERLRTEDYAEIDSSPNGLQVGTAEGDVERVAFAVDAARATAEAAIARDVDLLVTHHGLIWDGVERVTGRDYRRIAPLAREDVGLYVSHLPLDGHQELGNAAQLAELLELGDREPFGEFGSEYVGQRGRLAEPRELGALAATLEEELPTGASGVQVLGHGPREVRDVAIVTGSGSDLLDEAVDAGADVLVTGEGKQQVYHRAREAGVNVVLAGHYATETGGLRALQALVEEWGLETTFVEHPTGL